MWSWRAATSPQATAASPLSLPQRCNLCQPLDKAHIHHRPCSSPPGKRNRPQTSRHGRLLCCAPAGSARRPTYQQRKTLQPGMAHSSVCSRSSCRHHTQRTRCRPGMAGTYQLCIQDSQSRSSHVACRSPSSMGCTCRSRPTLQAGTPQARELSPLRSGLWLWWLKWGSVPL